MTKSLLVISYYSNMPGACQAEWVDDRIKVFLNQKRKIKLISSICCFKYADLNINHKRLQSIFPVAFMYEFEEIMKRNIFYNPNKLYYFKFYYKFSKISKKIFDFLKGEGRWDWFITLFFWSIFNWRFYKNIDYIYSTGGPPSAHLLGILIKKIFKKRLVVEFQDPLSGDDIGRNKKSASYLKKMEDFIIRHADLVIYCTETACNYSRLNHKEYLKKIHFVYPGSSLKSKASINENHSNNKINITYLGSLYQTRNLDNLLKAINNLSNKNIDIKSKLVINLYGNIDADIKKRILSFDINIIKIHGLITRSEVLIKAEMSDVLLLVQNTDMRSSTTIPFKVYDYLRLNKLIFGLTFKNAELNKILNNHGHIYCDADNINQIQSSLLLMLNSFDTLSKNIFSSNLTPELAVSKIENLIDSID